MKRIYKYILSLLLLVSMLYHPDSVSGYFSGQLSQETSATTGSTLANITSLTYAHGISEWSEEFNNLNDGFIPLNSSGLISFFVENIGYSMVALELKINLSWVNDYSAQNLFLYPENISDEQILADIRYNNASYALLSGTQGTLEGVIATTTLSLREKENFLLRLFLFEDSAISADPMRFHDQSISVTISVKLSGKSNWGTSIAKQFLVAAATATDVPTITEIAHPKTYFVTQSPQIDLTNYAIATDLIDGDITDRIIISSSPQFYPNVAGVYRITYTVTNSRGHAAMPLNITIIIWDFTKIESGYYHTLALTSHGKVYTWGYNLYGQLGDGTTAEKSIPKLVDLPHTIDIAAGQYSSYALTEDGTVYAWGRNTNGRLGDGTTTNRHLPVPILVPQGTRFVNVAAGFRTAGAITDSGEVYTWGYGGYGAAGTANSSDVRTPAKIQLSGIADLAFGYYNGIAVTVDGRVYTWGDNLHGQLGGGQSSAIGAFAPAEIQMPNGTAIKSISAGWYHMTATSTDGKLFSWGYGAEGRLGVNNNSDKNTPQEVALPAPALLTRAGFAHSGVVLADGSAMFFGQNAYGKHGNGSTSNASSPTPALVANATYLSLGLDSSFVLTDNQQVFGMGYGGTGVLGTGNNSNSSTPAKWSFLPPAPTR